MKATPELLKILNRSAVLSIILKEQPISRVEISKQTTLSKPTVSVLVDELLHENLILEQGEGSASKQGGRKPISLVVNPNAAYIVGVDIGAYKTLCVITDFSGRIVSQKRVFTEKGGDNISLILQTVHGMVDRFKEKEKLVGIGVGIPGIVDIDRGIAVSVPQLCWTDVPVRQMFEQEFSLKTYIDNDANMAALGEKWKGAATDFDTFVFISLGYGIGSGIYIDNKLYRGSSFMAGEIGYMALSKSAFNTGKYTLDRYGYLDSTASGSAILNRTNINSEEVFRRVGKGEPEAVGIVEDLTDSVAMAVSNVISLINPQAVILGGGVAKAGNRLLEPVASKVGRLSPAGCRIILTTLGEEAGVMGCTASVLTESYGIKLI